jgi:NAD-dependent dihydropyrimidine dehydrogenase PreA subunit
MPTPESKPSALHAPVLILCRVPPEESAALKSAFDALAGALASAGLPFAAVDSIYDMADDCPGVAFLRELRGDLILLGWHYARALRWTLVRHGVDVTAPERIVQCLNVRGIAPDAILAQLRVLLGTAAIQKIQLPEPRPEAKLDPRWYPVIDGGLCTNCMECLDFCLFGVYGVDQKEMLRVVSPNQCRQDCPACARVCPVGAIVFPKHRANPAIAGADAAPDKRGAKLDLSGIFGKPKGVQEATQERAEALAKSGTTPAKGEKAEQLSREFDKLNI